MRAQWVRSPRLFPLGRTGRRRARATALSVLVFFSCMLTTETAMAAGATLPPLRMPELSLSGLWEWAGKSPLDTPDQQGGTARGKSHRASAGATSAENGVGRKPGKGKGELDPYKRYVDQPETATTGPARGTAKSFNAETSERDAKKSTATSDYYVNADRSTTVRHFPGRTNFKGDDGTWKPIDTRLVEDKDGRLQERSNSLDVEFAPNAADQQLASVDFGSGRSLGYALRGAAKAEPSVAANGTATYAGVLPHTDVQLVPLAEGFKENLVLHSADAANSWTFPLDVKGLTPRIADDGDVEFTDADGKVTATIPHAFMEDSKVDPRSGDAAQSRAVSYELTTVDGEPALRMTADRAWLDDPERDYPVTVDPTVTASNSTYTQNTISGDHSTENQIKVGSYDSGTNKTNSFLQFSSLGTTLNGQKVSAATLNVYALWSATCVAQDFSVHPVTQSWTPSGVTAYPGPAYGAAIGSATPAPGASCSNSDGGTDVGVKMPVSLSTSWFTQVATGGANYGLALTAPTTDGLHWKKFHSDNSATAAWRPALDLTYTANTKPQVNAQYPPENFQANTLQPELLVYAGDADKWPQALKYTFEVYDADSESTTPVVTSGATPLTKGSWKIPAGKLKWSKNYVWYVGVSDGYEEVTHSSRFATAVPQPPVTSGLAQNTDGHEFDPSDGNYTTEDTDADVPVVGPSLEIDRSYNSLDPRIDSAFGAGWSTVVDMKAAETKDAAGTVTSVVITYPGGEQVAFGRNSDGTFVPPPGRYARLQSVTGGYTLTDKDFTAYKIATATAKAGTYAITSITDYAGRAETFTYTSGKLTKITNTTSNRSLTLDWQIPSGTTLPHVFKVTTDPSTAGDSNTAQEWQYTYTGDQLTKVCPPADPTKCTVYGYATGNHYRTTVLDADPFAYWRLGEAAGATVAKDAIDLNQGKFNGLFRNVTLGGTGPLAGSTQKAASFNGTTSYVEMPSAPGATPSYMSVSLWFKTSQSGGVLFYYGDKPLSGTDPVGTTTKNTPAVYVGTDGKLRGCLAMSPGCMTTITSTASVNDNQWHNAVLTGVANSQTLYLDGVSQGSLSGTINDWEQPYISLGAGVNTDGWPAMNANDKLGHFSGQLAEVAIYSEPLDPSVITAQHRAAKGSAGLLNRITTPGGKTQSSVVYGTTDDLVLQATDGDGGTWKLTPATVTGSSQVYRSAVMGSAPSGYWRLDDTQGAPQAANELHTGFGTYNTVTQGVAGPFGTGDVTAASFNGTSSYAEIPYATLHAKPNRSVELWFRTTKAGVIMSDQARAPNDPLGAGGAYSPLLYVAADGKLRGHWWSASGSGTTNFGSKTTVMDNVWHHAVLSASGTTQTMYLDGVKQADYTGAANDQTTARTFVGAGFTKGWISSPSDVSYFTGSIAEVAVYQAGLTADQVEQHWSAYKASSGIAPVRTVKLTDPTDKTLTYVYDAEMGNRLLAAIDTNGKRTTYGYDTAGFMHTVTDANGNRSISGHDIRGNTVSQTDCQDTAADKCATEYYTYYPDATTAFPPMDPRNDLPLTERDARSSGPTDNTYLTNYTYDTAGNVTSVTTPPVAGHPGGRTATTTYTTTATAAAEGGTAKAPAGLVDTVTTPGGKKTKYTYFANGDVAAVTDANGATAKYTYDNLGRQINENEISDAQPGGLATSFTYDKNDQVATETNPSVTNRVTGAVHQARTATSFDADGNVLNQTVTDLTGGDAARTTTMTYDAYNRMATRTDPGGDTTSFEYDVYGNKVKETDAAGTVNTYAFDGEGRPLTTNLLNYTGDPGNPSAPTTLVQESRAYDPAGRLASITDAMGWVTAYTYTDDGLAASVVRKDPANGKSFTEQANTYDMAGNLIKQVTNDGATTTTFAVDAADRTTSSVLDPSGVNRSSTVSYDPDDNVVSETENDQATGDVSTSDTTYDNLGNVTGTTVHDGTTAPVARYKLDETTGYSVGDSSGANHTGTHGTGMHWNTDRGGSAALDGNANSWAQTDGSVVNTGGSFTVSAWVKLNSTASNYTAVGQDGDHHSGFYLGYVQSANKWAIRFPTRDDASGTLGDQLVYSTAAPVTGQWTHLTSVYDATTAKISLYVNGTLQGTDDRTAPWSANGNLQIGRVKYAGAYDGFWPGGIDDVQVYGQALSASQVSGVQGGTLPAAGSSVRSMTWKLDERGLPVSSTDTNGNTTDYGYDEAAQQTTVTEPAVNAEQNGGTPVSVRPVSMTGYNTFGEATETSDPLGNVSVTAYDAEGQESATTSPGYTAPGTSTPITATAWNEYNRLGQVTAEVDPLGSRTTYAYTQLGDLASVTEPGGGTTTYTYDTNGDQLSATRPNGAREETTWDYLGRPVTSTDVVRQPTQRAFTAINEYNAPGGELSRTVSPTGVAESYKYNAIGETTEVTDAAGNTSTFTYDMDGQVLTTRGPDGTSSKNTYDGFGQLIATSDLDATGAVLRSSSGTYDRGGNPLTVTDFRGHTTTMTTDATGLVTKAVQPVSATESITTTFGYDAAGNRTRFTDGRGNPFLTTYNNWGLTESVIEPSTPAHPDAADRTFTTVYDANGRPKEQRSPGGVVITNEYDVKDRLTTQTGTGAEAETVAHTYAYDSDDRVTAVAGVGEEKNTFTYDDRGLVLSASGPSGDSSFAYNGDGAITSRTDASGTSTFGYDSAGRLKTANDGATGSAMAYGYDVNSQVTSVDYGAGKSKRAFSYDALGRLSNDKLTSPTGNVLTSITYGYDANDNETSKTTSGFAGAGTNTYTYDWANRLSSWNNGTTTEQYGYDASGNRTRVGGDTYTYDARNRLTSDGHSTYAYTKRGTMSSMTAEDGTQTAIKADAFNRVINEGDRTYTYDGLDRVLSAADETGTPLHSFKYSGAGNDVASDGVTSYSRNADGSLLGIKTAVSAALVMTDMHDDVVGQFTDSGEALAGSTTYSPFGKVVQSAGMLGQLGYQSGWTDPDTAKVNMAARWYSPETGQFNSRDTVGLNPLPASITANRYAYADANPMTATDPTGHWSFSGAWKAVKKKVKKTAKSAWKKTKKAVKKVAKVVRKAAKKIKRAVRKTVRKAYRAVRKTVRYVSDSVKRVKRYVKRTYKRVKRYAHKVVKHVKKTVRKVAKAVKHVAKKVVKAAKKVGRAVKKAAKATANFVKQHAATIASVAVGVVVFAGCTAATGGVGVIACGMAAGAAANAVGYAMSDGPKSVGGFLGAVAIGAATGALGGAAGGMAAGAVGRLLAGVGGKALNGAAMGAAGGAAEGAVGYGISCAASEEGCSVSGAAKATAVGAATGGVFGAAASRFGPKSKSAPEPDAQPSAPRPTGCRVPTPHSFTGLTGVLLANGLTKPISEVKAGDYVLTAEPGKKKKEKHRVKEVIVTKTDRNYVDVVVATKAGPKTIQTTKHHQFYEATRDAWTQAFDLKAGQKLQTADGELSRILKVKSYTAQRVTYDLSIEELHTYHVMAGPAAILVHNCNGRPTYDLTNPELVQEVANRAERAIPSSGSRAVDGTRKHKYAEKILDRYQKIFDDRGLILEESYLNRRPVSHGTKGSARPDVYDQGAGIAYDYKFTKNPPGIGKTQWDKNANHVPGLQLTIPVVPQ
ncbi:Teneurin-1 [Streptomyces lunaelactis]|nr:Teneurin-1 [Streptomyces lunaelactis]NUK36766.1 Teneurin-1 [Streptomyces lunaelactis]NUK44710.1 Teneurin-1 [Streptomyces lunaelactis]NUK94055.1 Teneurin-1 [Streptomyces lunaelactis]NUL12410.1 Teneurin-1 [Streptomyces lunaelactis]